MWRKGKENDRVKVYNVHVENGGRGEVGSGGGKRGIGEREKHYRKRSQLIL